MHQFVTFSTITPVQHGLADFLSSRRGLEELAAVLPAQAGFVPRADGRIAIPSAEVAAAVISS